VSGTNVRDGGTTFGSANVSGGSVTGSSTLTITFNSNATSARVQNLVRARITANEQLALQSARLISRSCQFFFQVQQQYPAALADLGPGVSNPPYIEDLLLLSGAKQGYVFAYSRPAPATFQLLINPQAHGTTGARHFYIGEDLKIHGTDEDRDATPVDPVVP
jgi:hypothetical protein